MDENDPLMGMCIDYGDLFDAVRDDGLNNHSSHFYRINTGKTLAKQNEAENSDEEVENFDEDEAENFDEGEARRSNILFRRSRSTVRHLKGLLKAMIESQDEDPHQKEYGGDMLAKGEGLAYRIKRFMSRRLRFSIRSESAHNDGKPYFMSYSSLKSIARNICTIVTHLNEDMSSEEVRRLGESLYKHANWLRIRYDLNVGKKEKIVFGPPEVQMIMEEAMSSTAKPYDIAVQFCTSLLTLFYTAGRPDSFFRSYQNNNHAKVGDIRIVRRKSETERDPTTGHPITVGFDVTVAVQSFVGYNEEQHISIKFKVRTIKLANNLTFDFGTWMVAMLYQRNALDGDPTVEELWNDGRHEVVIKSEFKQEPLFVKSTQEGMAFGIGPVTCDGFRHVLQEVCKKIGLSETWERGASVSAYCIRRGTAIMLFHELRKEKTQRYMGHKSASNTLYTDYYSDDQFEDILAAAFDGSPEEMRMDKSKPYLTAPRGNNVVLTITKAEAVHNDVMLRVIARDISDLKFCIKTNRFLDAMATVTATFKMRLHTIMSQDRKEALLTQQAIDDALTSKELKARFDEFNNRSSDLPDESAELNRKAQHMLDRVRLEQERALNQLEKNPAPVFRHCRELSIDIDVDEEVAASFLGATDIDSDDDDDDDLDNGTGDSNQDEADTTASQRDDLNVGEQGASPRIEENDEDEEGVFDEEEGAFAEGEEEKVFQQGNPELTEQDHEESVAIDKVEEALPKPQKSRTKEPATYTFEELAEDKLEFLKDLCEAQKSRGKCCLQCRNDRE
ncbi:hypothetical protein QFC19_007450 [Naganishia cerealis]|uniref:Uncharacterized protein n=1 Tax=Naganishia cerealis TaxID=610337 RepID=A0ACC2V8P3_9TREE|nr:hypothetical protein QFC19_007450 [Naganishia cerealis]